MQVKGIGPHGNTVKVWASINEKTALQTAVNGGDKKGSLP